VRGEKVFSLYLWGERRGEGGPGKKELTRERKEHKNRFFKWGRVVEESTTYQKGKTVSEKAKEGKMGKSAGKEFKVPGRKGEPRRYPSW